LLALCIDLRIHFSFNFKQAVEYLVKCAFATSCAVIILVILLKNMDMKNLEEKKGKTREE